MSGGHTNRSGRGGDNRRARHGPARPRNPQGQGGGQPRPAQPASFALSSARRTPAHEETPTPPVDAGPATPGSPSRESEAASTEGQDAGESRQTPPTSRPRSDRRAPQLLPQAPRSGVPAGRNGDAEAADDEVVEERSEHEPMRREVRGDVGPMIDSLHALFERDRAVASQGGSTRCGICYLHFPLAELEYRTSEGFYVCADCARALGNASVPMVRRQQHL